MINQVIIELANKV